MKSKKIYWILGGIIIAVVLGCLVVGVISKDSPKEPTGTENPELNTTVTVDDTKEPEIAPIESDNPTPVAKKGELDLDLNENTREESAVAAETILVEYETKELTNNEK